MVYAQKWEDLGLQGCALVSFAGLALAGPVYADQVEQATVSQVSQEVVAQTDHQVTPQAELAPSTTKEVPQVVEPSPSLCFRIC